MLKRFTLTYLVLTVFAPFVFSADSDQCMECHRRLTGEAASEARLFGLSVHYSVGLTCSSCHGGDSGATNRDDAKRAGTGFVSRPARTEIPAMCGSCHSVARYMKRFDPQLRIDQVSEYRTSKHGRRNAEGDTRVATCTSCHSTHDIRRGDDPESPVHRLRMADTCGNCHADPKLMKAYGITSDIVSQFKQSKHGTALYGKKDSSAPTCADCHGSHGSFPPAASSVVNVCSHCHEAESELFKKSAHFSAFMTKDLRGCIVCHQSHAADPMENALFSGMTGGCLACHRSDEAGKIAEQIGHGGLALRQSVTFSRKFLSDASITGIDITAPMRSLDLALQKIDIARTQIHSLDADAITDAIKDGMKTADAAYGDGMRRLEQLRVRSYERNVSFVLSGIVLVLGGVILVRTLRGRRRARESLRLERNRIQLSRERLARIGELSAGVAHTIRNPLHGLLNCVDILKARLGAENGQKELLDLMGQGLHRIENVTQRLLVLTREAPLSFALTDVGTLVEETARFVEVKCHKKDIQVRRELDKMEPVELDHNQISEALLNILNNAIDACDHGGSITIRTFLKRIEGHDYLHITVEDTGHGIAAEDLSKVFDPFFTTKPVGEGTGLGLAITRRIAEAHEGTVRVESQPGKGTSITLVIPALTGKQNEPLRRKKFEKTA